MKFMIYNFIFNELGYFFYSCLLLLLIEKQAVMWMLGESWLLELYFLSACGFIFVYHCIFVGLLRFLLSFVFVHLLAREVQDSVTSGLSMSEGAEHKFSLNICIKFCKTVQLDANQQFCRISKDNSTILRQFKNFLIPLRTVRYFSC